MRPAPVVAALLLLVTAAPAYAADRGLSLSVSGDANTWTRGVVLRCHPAPGGHHPNAAAACAAIEAAGGRFDRFSGTSRACTMEYNPVTASATGSWRGRPVSWRATYANACGLEAATGAVFRF
ncbi:SSI family serine proteinase inhibitor [Nonomuraea longicatena]|uniref:Subtilisin inhibitor domain-containing protein n=1 Tax=Nonomuraea longicatena TaxID=83682 RepID=A0ABN1QWI6_9ACTN